MVPATSTFKAVAPAMGSHCKHRLPCATHHAVAFGRKSLGSTEVRKAFMSLKACTSSSSVDPRGAW
eukprot:4310941-Alexandrium_andersonii.AAC.1